MKKFLITLLFLIIAGGVVFYFGWVQIQIPAEGYAVFFSKTNGYDEDVIEPGKFVWRWQRLIPTNVKMHIFEPEIHEHTVTVEGELPSGALYADFLRGDPDFSWQTKIFIRFTINPESLPELVQNEHVQPEELSAYYDSVYEKTESYVYPRVLSFLNKADNSGEITTDVTDLEKILYDALSDSFPSIDFVDIHIASLEMPDLDLYLKGKRNYQQISSLEQQVRREEISAAAEEEAEKSRALSLLKEYGKVLSEYPVLMDYLEIKGSFEELAAPQADVLPVFPEDREE